MFECMIYKRTVYDSLDRVNDIANRRAEFEKLEAYFEKENLELTPTENGLYFLIQEPGHGPFPVLGDSVVVNYSGFLLDGKKFDTNEWNSEPFRFVLGQNMVLPGWEEGIPMLNKGAKARFYITSDLAFGARHVGEVPPYSTLIFDIEVLDIIH